MNLFNYASYYVADAKKQFASSIIRLMFLSFVHSFYFNRLIYYIFTPSIQYLVQLTVYFSGSIWLDHRALRVLTYMQNWVKETNSIYRKPIYIENISTKFTIGLWKCDALSQYSIENEMTVYYLKKNPLSHLTEFF